MVDFREHIAGLILEALQKKKAEKQAIMDIIEVPPENSFGDYALPCFRLAADLKKNPNEIALDVASKIRKSKNLDTIKVVGGYVNFFINKSALASQTIGEILKKKKKYGTSKIGKKKRVMVEYSAPNTNKPLHIGHVRNGAIGAAISNLLEFTGHKVVRANLLNDRGIHICKTLTAYQKWGKKQTPKQAGVKPDYFVGKFYVMFEQKAKDDPRLIEEAREVLKKWEAKDKATIRLWKKMNEWVLAGFKETYKKYGSEFDVWFSESRFYDKAKPIIKEGTKKGLFAKNDLGMLVAKLEPHGLANKTILRADGTTIYITNDLALTKHKFKKFKLKESIWVVASEQMLYFQQLFKIFELLGYKWAKDCYHLSYGLVFLPEGKLKSREGKVIEADELLISTEKQAIREINAREKNVPHNELMKRARAIALAAIKFNMLKIDANKDFTFDISSSLNFEGETGPYLLYTCARATNILKKAGKRKKKKIKWELLKEKSETELLSAMSKFPEAVENSVKNMSPHIICQYLLDVASKFNTFYHDKRVLQAEEADVREARLSLVDATKTVLTNGLNLLGVSTLERM